MYDHQVDQNMHNKSMFFKVLFYKPPHIEMTLS